MKKMRGAGPFQTPIILGALAVAALIVGLMIVRAATAGSPAPALELTAYSATCTYDIGTGTSYYAVTVHLMNYGDAGIDARIRFRVPGTTDEVTIGRYIPAKTTVSVGGSLTSSGTCSTHLIVEVIDPSTGSMLLSKIIPVNIS